MSSFIHKINNNSSSMNHCGTLCVFTIRLDLYEISLSTILTYLCTGITIRTQFPSYYVYKAYLLKCSAEHSQMPD